MRRATERNTELHWNLFVQLVDLDFTDNKAADATNDKHDGRKDIGIENNGNKTKSYENK